MSKFSLGQEERLWVRKCLIRLGFSGGDLEAAISEVEKAIERFLNQPRRATARTVYDQLRRLYGEAILETADPDPLYKLFARLCPEAMSHLETRALHVLPRMFPKHKYDGSLKDWAARVPATVLAKALVVLIPDGGKLVTGKLGKAGRRSRARFQLRIFDLGEGLGNMNKEGRPAEDERVELIGRLANLVTKRTGDLPKFGRSDGRPFGDLVHTVFQICGFESGEAAYALRAYREWCIEAGVLPAKKKRVIRLTGTFRQRHALRDTMVPGEKQHGASRNVPRSE